MIQEFASSGVEITGFIDKIGKQIIEIELVDWLTSSQKGELQKCIHGITEPKPNSYVLWTKHDKETYDSDVKLVGLIIRHFPQKNKEQ